MTQQLRESLSAIMDGEGNELELRRVLKTLEDFPEQVDTWRRYHLMRSAMRRERSITVDVDVASSVMAAIRQESVSVEKTAVNEASGAPVRARRYRGLSLMSGAAVAAAVSLMVVTGVQFYRGHGQTALPETGLLQANNDALDSAAQQLASTGSDSTGALGVFGQGNSAMPVSYADFSSAANGTMMPVSWNTNAQPKPHTHARRYAADAPHQSNDSVRFKFDHGLRP